MNRYKELVLLTIISLFLVFAYNKYSASEYIISKNVFIVKSQSVNNFYLQDQIAGIASTIKKEMREIKYYIQNIGWNSKIIYDFSKTRLGAKMLSGKSERSINIEVKHEAVQGKAINKTRVIIFLLHIIVFLIFVIIAFIVNKLKKQKTEDLLRASKERYKNLLMGIPNTVILIEDGVLKFINQVGINFLGASSKEEITYNKLKELFLGNIDFDLIETSSRCIETRIRTLVNEIKDVELTIVTDNKDTGNESIIILIQDISHKKILYASRERERIRNELFANLSHEFKTPINLMLSSSTLLEQAQNKEEDIRRILPKSVKVLKQNSYRLIRLVNNIIDSIMIDSGNLKLNLYNCNIVELTEDITLSTVKYAKYSNIEVLFDTEVEELEIALDQDQYERIILNLLSNAIKYNKRGGSIIVNINKKQNDVVISVKDTGIGISSEMLPYIFERFMQADKSFIRNVEGSGMGLTLVKALVGLHNGRIEVISKQGIGTEFILYFPIYTIDNKIGRENKRVLLKYKDRNTKIELSDIYVNR
ncbi:MAG: hypothetical protein K0S71_2917 [Clostridia bacterium]|jgi:signal transduction histidine kinase|nr:hypothetical protein [Clostridia bacterium]